MPQIPREVPKDKQKNIHIDLSQKNLWSRFGSAEKTHVLVQHMQCSKQHMKYKERMFLKKEHVGRLNIADIFEVKYIVAETIKNLRF